MASSDAIKQSRDKAKKEFAINSVYEIGAIKEVYMRRDKKGRMIKPNFFGVIARKKGYYDTERKNYKRHDTTMDYIQKYCTSIVRREKEETLPFSSLLRPFDLNWKMVNCKQLSGVIGLVRDTRTEIARVWNHEEMPKTDRYMIASDLRQECIERIAALSFNSHTMYRLLCSIEYPSNRDIGRTLFSYLFGVPNESFFKLIEGVMEPRKEIALDKDGDIVIYGERYSKQYPPDTGTAS